MPLLLAASVLTGHAQETYYLALTLTMWALMDLVARWRHDPRRKPPLSPAMIGSLGLALALTAGILAVELVPDWMAHAYVRRGLKPTAADASKYHVHITNLVQLLSPLALGGPADYRGRGSYWESLLSFGLIPLILAILGAARSRRRSAARGFSLLALISILFAFGRGGLVFDALFAIVPGMGTFRVPSRSQFLTAVAVAALAALGIDAITRQGPGRRRLALAIGFLAIAETTLYGFLLIQVAPPSQFLGPDPVGEAIQEHRPDGPFRIRARDAFYGDARAFALGLEKTNLNDSFQVGFAADLYERLYPMFGEPIPKRFPDRFRADLQADVMSRMNVAMLVSDRDDPRINWPLVAEGEWDGTRFRLRANPDPLPRAYVVPRAVVAPDGPGTVDLFLENPGREAVLMLRDPMSFFGERQPFTPATYRALGPDRIEIEVTRQKPGLLVVSDTWMPGWAAEVDGQPVGLLRGNRAQRVVSLAGPPGRNRIVMTYTPPGLAIGRAITAMSLATWLLTLMIAGLRSGIRRARKAGRSR